MDIKYKYRIEINEIETIIENLKNGFVKEISGINAHGNISTHAKRLETGFSELIYKISEGKPSKMDEHESEVSKLQIKK